MAGLYIHVPFCSKKCPYCDFVSGPFPVEVQVEYLKAVRKEIAFMARRPDVSSMSFDTLYVGGGTPSVVPVRKLVSVLEAANDSFSWSNTPLEITVEANPESVTKEGLEELMRAGVNRLSLGIQDLSDNGLKALGRSHSVSDAFRAYGHAREAGFSAISLDLIYGFPGQSVKHWQQTLEQAVSLLPDHISCYELTVEKDTPLERAVSQGVVKLPEEDTVIALTDLTEDFLSDNGYEQYEISNFALYGKECRHNITYWENGAYLGIGCSSVSFLPPRRDRNTTDLQRYIDLMTKGRRAVDMSEVLDPETRFRESVVLALRLVKGISLHEFSARWGYDPVKYYGEKLSMPVERELIALDDNRLMLTKKGRRLADTVLSELV